jgi:hypothetical protein
MYVMSRAWKRRTFRRLLHTTRDVTDLTRVEVLGWDFFGMHDPNIRDLIALPRMARSNLVALQDGELYAKTEEVEKTHLSGERLPEY